MWGHRAKVTPETVILVRAWSLSVFVLSCKLGWTAVHDQCYYKSSVTYTYSDAIAQCNVESAVMLSLEDNTVATNIFTNLGISSGSRPWLGLQIKSGSWQWTDASVVFNEYVFNLWGSGQPAGGEDCAYWENDNTWKDAPCASKYIVICVQAMPSTTESYTTTEASNDLCIQRQDNSTSLTAKFKRITWLAHLPSTAHTRIKCAVACSQNVSCVWFQVDAGHCYLGYDCVTEDEMNTQNIWTIY